MDARSRSAAALAAIALVAVLAIVLLARTPGEEAGTEFDRTVENVDTTAAAPEAPASRYDPVLAGEPLPRRYRPLLPRDAIRPVYQPAYVEAKDSPWNGEALVIGVEIDGHARAYPVSYLNHREMVIDRLSGVPILVSW